MITASRRPRSRATSSDSKPRPRRRGLVAGGEDGRQVSRPERPRQPRPRSAAVRRVAGKDPGRPVPGRARLAGEAPTADA